jgi:hypothetical protein
MKVNMLPMQFFYHMDIVDEEKLKALTESKRYHILQRRKSIRIKYTFISYMTSRIKGTLRYTKKPVKVIYHNQA